MANVILSKIFETIISVTCWKRDPFPIFYEVVAVVEEVLILKVLTLKEFSRQVSDSASVHYNFSFFPDELRNFRDILVTQLNISIFLAPNRSFSNFITLFIYRCNKSKCQMQWMWAASKYDFCVNKIWLLWQQNMIAPSLIFDSASTLFWNALSPTRNAGVRFFQFQFQTHPLDFWDLVVS